MSNFEYLNSNFGGKEVPIHFTHGEIRGEISKFEKFIYLQLLDYSWQ